MASCSQKRHKGHKRFYLEKAKLWNPEQIKKVGKRWEPVIIIDPSTGHKKSSFLVRVLLNIAGVEANLHKNNSDLNLQYHISPG